MPPDRGIAGMVTAVACLLTAALVLLPPVFWWQQSARHLAGGLEAEAEINAGAITQIIGADPDLWQFEQVRMAEVLARRPRRGEPEQRRVRNLQGQVVAESADPLDAPVLTHAVPLLDAGAAVGTIEISRSLRPPLVRSGLLLLALLPVGLLAFRVLRTLPLRAIRHSQEALRRSRDRVDRWLDAAGAAFVVLDREGRVVRANRSAGAILARPPAEMVGQPWAGGFVDPADRARIEEAMAAAARGEGAREVEYGVLRPGGDRRVLHWTFIPVEDEEDVPGGLLGSGVDLTRQRQLEEQLRMAQKLEAIGKLAGGVAHDFNNILSTIKGYAALVRDELPADGPLRQDVAEILSAADRAANLVRSLLTFSRRPVLEAAVLDLGELLRRSERFLGRLLREGVDLAMSPPPAPLLVRADPVQLEQLLMNLVTNARDAIPGAGRVAVSARRVELDADGALDAGLDGPGAYARLEVSDTGVGIDREAQARVFEPFFTTKAVGEGTGLGLAIVYGVVRQHQGAVHLASEVGQGSTFTVLLPAVES